MVVHIERKADLAHLIDHTLLEPSANAVQIDILCKEADDYGFYSVCVNPYYVARCKLNLRNTDVRVTSVIGFPFGATFKETKASEAAQAIREGADELDMVMNIGAAKSGKWEEVEDDISAVSAITKDNGKVLKVILETGYLTDDEKVLACKASESAGANFVKTSTGFGKGLATVHDITLMANTVGGRLGVKASGGIHNFSDAMAMINAGATRIGSSHSVEIVESFNVRLADKLKR